MQALLDEIVPDGMELGAHTANNPAFDSFQVECEAWLDRNNRQLGPWVNKALKFKNEHRRRQLPDGVVDDESIVTLLIRLWEGDAPEGNMCTRAEMSKEMADVGAGETRHALLDKVEAPDSTLVILTFVGLNPEAAALRLSGHPSEHFIKYSVVDGADADGSDDDGDHHTSSELDVQMDVLEETKTRGNEMFRAGDNAGAVECYTQIIDALKTRVTLGACDYHKFKTRPEVHKIFLVALSNRAQCHLNLADYKAANNDCADANGMDSIGWHSNIGLRKKISERQKIAREKLSSLGKDRGHTTKLYQGGGGWNPNHPTTPTTILYQDGNTGNSFLFIMDGSIEEWAAVGVAKPAEANVSAVIIMHFYKNHRMSDPTWWPAAHQPGIGEEWKYQNKIMADSMKWDEMLEVPGWTQGPMAYHEATGTRAPLVHLTITPASYKADVRAMEAVQRTAGVGVAVDPAKHNPKCSHCALEETAAEAKFRHCACHPAGAPFYCGKVCQKADWPNHKVGSTVQVEPGLTELGFSSRSYNVINCFQTLHCCCARTCFILLNLG